jgi:hypothetical protein
MITDEKIDEIVKASKMLNGEGAKLVIFSNGSCGRTAEEMSACSRDGIYSQIWSIDRPVTHEEVRRIFEDLFGERKCYNLNARRTLKRLGIPYEIKEGEWYRSGRFWKKPKYVRCLTWDDEQKYEAEREKLIVSNAKQRQRARQRRQEQEVELEKLAKELGVLRNSRTFKLYLDGEIDRDEAMRIGEITRYRHEETNYEELLEEGFDREEARELMMPR